MIKSWHGNTFRNTGHRMPHQPAYPGGFALRKASNSEHCCVLCSWAEQAFELWLGTLWHSCDATVICDRAGWFLAMPQCLRIEGLQRLLYLNRIWGYRVRYDLALNNSKNIENEADSTNIVEPFPRNFYKKSDYFIISTFSDHSLALYRHFVRGLNGHSQRCPCLLIHCIAIFRFFSSNFYYSRLLSLYYLP